jgi:hypothetical protein
MGRMRAVQYSRPANLSKISHFLLADGWHEIDGVEADLDDPDKIIFRKASTSLRSIKPQCLQSRSDQTEWFKITIMPEPVDLDGLPTV